MKKRNACIALCTMVVCCVLAVGAVGCSPTKSAERKAPDEVSTSIVSKNIGVDAFGSSKAFDFDCSANKESTSLSKYGWYELADEGSHLIVNIPAEAGYDYSYGIFNEEIVSCDSETTSDDAYTLTFSGSTAGHTSLRFTGCTSDTGRTDGSAVINVRVDGNGKMNVYETSFDFARTPDRYDYTPIS